jgi:glycosyltransferase involved in cell wall biosynthesis
LLTIAYITPKLPRKKAEISYSFVAEELEELKKISGITSYVIEINYKDPFKAISEFSRFTSLKNLIQLMHAHFAMPYGFLAALITKAIKKPLIITVHGFDILVSKELRYGVNRFTLIKSLTKYTLNKASKIIANSACLRNECIKYGADPSKIAVIPYGVNLHIFKPIVLDNLEGELPNFLRDLVRKKNDFIIIFCAKRLEKIYGIEYLLKAAKILSGKTTRNFLLILLGGKMFKKYFKLVHHLGLSKNVIFMGMMPKRVMPLLYNVSDFTVVPSLVEGFGLVVAESLACGKPVIGSRVGGIVDQIIDGYNGYLVHPKDPLSLAEIMQTLIEDDSLRIEMSKNARIYAEANLDLKIRIDRLLKIYNEVVDT